MLSGVDGDKYLVKSQCFIEIELADGLGKPAMVLAELLLLILE